VVEPLDLTQVDDGCDVISDHSSKHAQRQRKQQEAKPGHAQRATRTKRVNWQEQSSQRKAAQTNTAKGKEKPKGHPKNTFQTTYGKR